MKWAETYALTQISLLAWMCRRADHAEYEVCQSVCNLKLIRMFYRRYNRLFQLDNVHKALRMERQ